MAPDSQLISAVPAQAMPIVRVAVLAAGEAGGRVTDMALPTELPLREILPAVRRMAMPADEEFGDSGPVTLSLAPVGGAPFSLDATLNTVGVVDGDLLALQPIPAGPPAPRIVEDIGDAAVIFSAARETPWGPLHILRGAAAAVIGLILVTTALATLHRAETGGYAGLIATSAIAVLTVLAALVTWVRMPRLGTALAVTALAPIAAALALAVPGEFGPSQVLLAAAGVTTWSIMSITVAQRAVAVFTAATVIGAGALIPAGAAAIWDVDSVIVGSILVLMALIVTVQAAQYSALWSRLPVPVIPAPGDPAPSAPPLRVLADLPRRVRLSDSHQTGFIAGGVLLGTAGALTLAAPQDASNWAWYIVGAVALGAVLRARVWDSALCKAWLLGQPFLMAVSLTVAFVVDDRYTAAWWATAAVAALTVVWVIAALFPRVASPETYSLPMRRLVGFLASGVDASVLPVLAHLVGLFAWVLNR
ncbi:type VII secretion integral membrane protein EccD [Mycobacterium sp. IDR2000157661]|uniref:type VII secretion integral membrane protein EccD n=1 Tax=Mycobacterium sp. IDR2000157661 TaxID=2867005 RepID=UPI00272DFBD2|nr:type VII secretion integral membrane protein EccD [Mycobacterium sp. IDR2000157661]ULE34404.1 type VII secretion integral membrane protein EccD [Mycobacterium sp. IDR2000157661]